MTELWDDEGAITDDVEEGVRLPPNESKQNPWVSS